MNRCATVTFSLFAALAVTAALPGAARADAVTDRIDKGRAHYEAGRLSAAARELQWAVGRIRRRIADGVAETFPQAPDGWTVRKARKRNAKGFAMMQGLVVQRRYRQTGKRGRVTAQLIADSPIISMMVMMFANPAVAQNAGYERIDVEGLPQGALVRFNEDRHRGDVVAMIGGRAFLKIDGRHIDSDAMLRAMIKGWNIQALKKHLGLK